MDMGIPPLLQAIHTILLRATQMAMEFTQSARMDMPTEVGEQQLFAN